MDPDKRDDDVQSVGVDSFPVIPMALPRRSLVPDAPLQTPKVRTSESRSERLSREFDDHSNHVRQVPNARPEQPSTEEQDQEEEEDPTIIIIAVERRLAASTRGRLIKAFQANQFWLPLSQRAPSPLPPTTSTPLPTAHHDSELERLGAQQVGYNPNARPGVTVQQGENERIFTFTSWTAAIYTWTVKDTCPNPDLSLQPELKERKVVYGICRKVAGVRMPDASQSPSKRRKTKGPYMKPRKPMLIWPAGLLPVEIFALIIDHLPRSSIQSLRLVNKEFEDKVSPVLFKVVVVPFRPEIYGIAPETTSTNDGPQSSVLLQDKGMRVFEGFGKWIQKFAMSFEIDPEKLASPPVKCDQEAIVSFWGIYRWPYKNYNRYSQLEGLEQTADETRSMAKALTFIKNAKELGLSIDGGLGWLAGPDTNQRVLNRGQNLSVFGESRFFPEPTTIPSKQPREKRSESRAAQPGSMRAAFERMLQEAGYLGENLEPSIRMMLENEAADEDNQWESRPWDNFASRTAGNDNLPARVPGAENWRVLTRRRGHVLAETTTALDEDAASQSYSEDDEDDDGQLVPALAFSCKAKAKTEAVPLKPNDLTNAQKEMLLELSWAQEAFMQSYVIAVIDNHKSFENIQVLNIARLPSRHLAILRRQDFWDSLEQVKKLSLGIIPDWRKVVKEETSWVQDTRIVPSLSIAGIYQLLSQQISERSNITDLHFEWVCGGEYDVGLFARNQHVMAAPLVSEAIHMVNRAHEHPILTLPHIQHLSLKNCWISPHIVMRFMTSLRESSLQSLTLDSVSLTAPLAPNAQPAPLTQAGIAPNPPNPQNAQNQQNHGGLPGANVVLVNPLAPPGGPPGIAQNAQNAPAQPPPAPLVNNQQNTANDWLQPPRPGSWAEIIDSLTPGITLADLRYSRDNLEEPPAKEPTAFIKFALESCGYVRLPLDFDQAAIDPPQVHTPLGALVTKRIADLDPFMMKSHDANLGVIVNHISAAESATLQNAWNMTTDWGFSRQELLSDSRADGVPNPGRGRLSGLVEATRSAASNSSSN